MNEWVWSVGGMILTGENRSAGRKTGHSATLSTINLIWTDLGSKLGHRGERPTNDRQRHCGMQNDHCAWNGWTSIYVVTPYELCVWRETVEQQNSAFRGTLTPVCHVFKRYAVRTMNRKPKNAIRTNVLTVNWTPSATVRCRTCCLPFCSL